MLSPGHGSTLLYSLLLTGYDLPMEEDQALSSVGGARRLVIPSMVGCDATVREITDATFATK